jgi:hypothetical protein
LSIHQGDGARTVEAYKRGVHVFDKQLKMAVIGGSSKVQLAESVGQQPIGSLEIAEDLSLSTRRSAREIVMCDEIEKARELAIDGLNIPDKIYDDEHG